MVRLSFDNTTGEDITKEVLTDDRYPPHTPCTLNPEP